MVPLSAKRARRLVVHVALDDFANERGRGLDEALRQTSLLKECLQRHDSGWERPSADEAVLVKFLGESAKPAEILSWAERLRGDVQSTLGMGASIGIAGTRLAARVASRAARPRGLLVLLPGYETDFLSSVALEEIDEIRPKQLAVLRRRGIRTVGELAGLSTGEARDLLGAEGARLVYLVRGIETRLDRGRANRVQRVVAIACQRATRKLQQGRFGARGLELRLSYGDGVSLERYTLMARPTWTFRDLDSSARDLLRFFPIREEPVVGVALTATGIVPRPGELPLFSRPRDVRVQLGRV